MHAEEIELGCHWRTFPCAELSFWGISPRCAKAPDIMPVKFGGAGGESNPQEPVAFQEPAPRTVAAHELQGRRFRAPSLFRESGRCRACAQSRALTQPWTAFRSLGLGSLLILLICRTSPSLP